MSNSPMTRTLPLGALTLHRIVSAYAAAMEAVTDWNRARRTAETLRRLTPEQLDDIGLTPADVDMFLQRGKI